MSHVILFGEEKKIAKHIFILKNSQVKSKSVLWSRSCKEPHHFGGAGAPNAMQLRLNQRLFTTIAQSYILFLTFWHV
jgi:hypothetical protein